MHRVGEFEKVSFEQFQEDFQAGGFAHLNKDIDDFVLVSEEEIRLMWESIEIPSVQPVALQVTISRHHSVSN